MKTIRIFIGSSVEDLEQERIKLISFIQGLNNKYHNRDIFIEGYLNGAQLQQSDYIKSKADVTIFMFYHCVGEYTLQELRLAHAAFVEKGKPNVYVFFKSVDAGEPAPDEDIKQCIKVIFDEYGHYYNVFSHVDTIKLELLQALSDSLPGKPELLVKDGKVYLSEELIDNISAANVFAYQNNPEIKRLQENMAKAKSKMIEASNGGDFDAVLRYSTQYNELENTYHTLEKDILDTLAYFAKENAKGAKADPRRMRALQLLELGRIAEAKALITQEELDRRAESIARRKQIATEQFQKEELDLVEDAKVRIQALKNDASNPERFAAIEVAYQSAYAAAISAKEHQFLYDYICFLDIQNKAARAIELGEELNGCYNNDKQVPEPVKVMLMNELGILYRMNGRLQDAETILQQALSILRARAKDNEDANFYTSIISNTLGLLYDELGKSKEATELYQKAISYWKECLGNNELDFFKAKIALLYSNLGILYSKMYNMPNAEPALKESLRIRRDLYEKDPATYAPLVAASNLNLGTYYRGVGNTREAETYYLEAINIFRKLSQDNYNAYEQKVALMYYNLGSLYYEEGRYQESESLFNDALAIYRRLTKANPVAYAFELANTCNNYGLLCEKLDRTSEAEALFGEALDLYRKNASYYPDCKKSISMACNNLGRLYSNSNRDAAETLFLEAIDNLRSISNDDRLIVVLELARTYCNRAMLYDNKTEFDKKEALYLDALEMVKGHMPENPYLCETLMANIHCSLATLYKDNKQMSKSIEHHQKCLIFYRKLLKKQLDAENKHKLLLCCWSLGIIHQTLGNFAEAEKAFLEGIEIGDGLLIDAPDEFQDNVALLHMFLADLYADNNRLPLTESHYLKALDIYRRLYGVNPNLYASYLYQDLMGITLLYLKIGKTEEANKFKEEAKAVEAYLDDKK